MPLVGPDSQPQSPPWLHRQRCRTVRYRPQSWQITFYLFQHGPNPGAAGPTMGGRFSRAIFQIGARRFVLEFRTSVTELHPVDTPAAPISQPSLIDVGPQARAV